MLTFQNPDKIPVVPLIGSRWFFCYLSFCLFISIGLVYHMRSFKGSQYTNEVAILVHAVLKKLELLLLDVLLIPMGASETLPRNPCLVWT